MGTNNGNPKNRKVTGHALFPLGVCVATPGANEVIDRLDLHPLVILARHASGDWGDCPDEDKVANEAALAEGARVMSVYKFGDDTLWVITEWDRSVTTILTPDEY